MQSAADSNPSLQSLDTRLEAQNSSAASVVTPTATPRQRGRGRFSLVAVVARPASLFRHQDTFAQHRTEEAAQIATQRRLSRCGSSSTTAGDVTVHQEAIEAFSVVAALTLGFSFSALVAVACELTEDLKSGLSTVTSFCVMMAAATALSGYSCVFFTMEVYYVKRLSDEGGANVVLRLETFLAYVGYGRKLARNATVGALAIDMIAIGVLMFGFLPFGWGVTVLAFLIAGSVLVLFTMISMRQLTAHCLRLGSEDAAGDARGEGGASISNAPAAVKSRCSSIPVPARASLAVRRGVDGEVLGGDRRSLMVSQISTAEVSEPHAGGGGRRMSALRRRAVNASATRIHPGAVSTNRERGSVSAGAKPVRMSRAPRENDHGP